MKIHYHSDDFATMIEVNETTHGGINKKATGIFRKTIKWQLSLVTSVNGTHLHKNITSTNKKMVDDIFDFIAKKLNSEEVKVDEVDEEGRDD